MKIDSNTLFILANELENLPPMTKQHYLSVIRLYANEPWRLENS